MPRYFFHLHDDLTAIDEEGAVLPNIDAARAHAITNIRDLICEEVRQGRINLSHRVEVADAAGRPVLTVHYSEAVQLQG